MLNKPKMLFDLGFPETVKENDINSLHSIIDNNGRLTTLPYNNILDHDDYVVAPSTFLIDVESLCDDTKYSEELCRELHRLLHGSKINSPHKRHTNDVIRCRGLFKCTDCGIEFYKNTLNLKEPSSGDFVDPLTCKSPVEECYICHYKCIAEKIEPFDPRNKQHLAKHKHSPDNCPICLKHGSWCQSARWLSQRTPKIYDEALIRLCLNENAPKWEQCEEGIVIPNLCYKKVSFKITLYPHLFVQPTRKRDLAFDMSLQAGLLLFNKLPTEISCFNDILVSINYTTRRERYERSATDHNEGAWYNSMVELFLKHRRVHSSMIDGFARYGMPQSTKTSLNSKLADWHVAYHGTNQANAAQIFFDGKLKNPKTKDNILHGQAGSPSGNSIYTSPSKEYSAFPTYSKIFGLRSFADTSKKKVKFRRFAQILYEVKVKPEKYQIRNSTLDPARHWPKRLRIDPVFETHNDLEWLIESSDDIQLSAILVREFGEGTENYGPINSIVKDGWSEPSINSHARRKGPGYHWTHLRKKMYEEKKLFALQEEEPRTAYVRNAENVVIASLVVSPIGRNHKIAFKSQATRLRGLRNIETLNSNTISNLLDPTFIDYVISASSESRLDKRNIVRSHATNTTNLVNSNQSKVDNGKKVYLCVEKVNANVIKRTGYRTTRRHNVAVSLSTSAALTGYHNWRRADHSFFEVLQTAQIPLFQNNRGCWRLRTNHIPASLLIPL